MSERKVENIDILDKIIVGRIEPYIYAFTTNTVPNYLKIGDTYRTVSKRLEEWGKIFPDLEKKYENKAIINEKVYFRDYSIHQYLENDLKKKRLMPVDSEEGIYYSREFFRDIEIEDVDNAIEDIKNNYSKNTNKYDYYSLDDKSSQEYHYQRGEVWTLRPNQKEAVDNFEQAIKNGRTNLLMYAVMRFGKSFTSLCCALKMGAKLVLVVSAKADVKEEWKKTVESAGNFYEYIFLESSDLEKKEGIIKENLLENKKIIIFLTLQDLQGEDIKNKHKELLSKQVDLLIVDETHFGARAESFGKILNNSGYDVSDEKKLKKFKEKDDENIDVKEVDEEIKKINAKVRLHLSGTPYRILMGSEFQKEDIISFVQFSDIVKEQEEWDKINLNKDEINEWDNPYYGFPQMIRFAFNPNKSSREKMEMLKKNGINFTLSKLFEPQSITKDDEKKYKKFINKNEILDLLQVIDGSKEDDELLGFLDYNKIKNGKMCRHMVMVLPYCASCDAMEELLKNKKDIFKNLGEYKVINISGVDALKKYKKPNDIKTKIKECEIANQKTITLTVNRMLTGSTVEEWDTMLYFKDTSSPQEYDQAIFRLQNQYIRTLYNEEKVIKENLKPQTLLVDFAPDRLFRMQEQKSLIYNVNIDLNGNNKLEERIAEEIRISPIIMMNHNKIKEVQATNILDAISEYNNQKSIFDEVSELPVDLSILDNMDIRKAIESQGEFNSKQGLMIEANQGEGEELDIEEHFSEKENPKIDKEIDNSKELSENTINNEIKKLENKIKTYYQRLLFFSFLTKDEVNSLDDILKVINKEGNIRLAKNLYLKKEIIEKICQYMNPFKRSSLDYKVKNISKLANDKKLEPLERAIISIKKFNRMSESEVITPSKICDEMVNLLPKEGIKKIIDEKQKLLDIASKSGEYTVALYKRLISDKLGYSHNKIKDILYSIPTSSIAYEFTRRFYEILGLNINNISVKFNAYDLIKIKDKDDQIDYDKINNLLKQNKKFSEINLEDEIKVSDEKVKFGVVIGNPPYQISDGGAQASAKPIYQHFILLGKKIGADYSCYITPTRWFAGGKGLDDFRDVMLKDRTLKELHDFLTPEDVFPNTNNRGGVCYFISDIGKVEETIRVVTHKNNNIIADVKRKLLIDGIDIFIRDSKGIDIINKIKGNNIVASISSRKPFGIAGNIINSKNFIDTSVEQSTSSLKPFGLRGYFVNDKNYKKELKGMKEPILCYGRRKQIGFVEKNLVNNNKEYIANWKIFIPRANNIGTELNDDNLNAFIGKPNEICTESYIMIGANLGLNEESAENFIKYLKTKFTRYLHSLAKASQDATAKTFRFVPLQNFTNSSDIDWTKSVEEIDEQLFNKYNLSNEEKEHIKNTIKDM